MTSTKNEFQFACKLSELVANGIRTLELSDRFVVLTLIDGQVYCVDDVCTHDGGTLSDGELEGYCLVCPRHGAKFDVRNGQAMCMPATEPTVAHEVLLEGDNVMVHLLDN